MQDCRIYSIDCFGLTGGCLDRMAGLQDLQDRLFWLSCGLTMVTIAGLQELQDRLFWLSCGLTMDRIAGLHVLQDKGFNKTNSGA